MALNLNTPALDDKPTTKAETRLEYINRSLAVLHSESTLDIAYYLLRELEILNRQKVSASQRLQALDTYKPILVKTAQSLADVYTNASLPLQDKAKLAANATELLWLELGYGYKLALIDLQNQLIKLGTEKNSARAIHQAMHAISEQAMVCYQTYAAPPEHIWSDLHQLYICATQLDLQNFSQNLNVENAPASATTNPAISIENNYKIALLMSLADTKHIAQHDIRLIADYLTYHVERAVITNATPEAISNSTFLISLESNKQPSIYRSQKESPNPTSHMLLHTIDLIRAIHDDLNLLQNQQLPSNGSIPSIAKRDDYISLLTYLIKHWGVTPTRFYHRSSKNGDIELVSGIFAIHKVSSDIIKETSKQEGLQHKIQKTTPSHWQILNISATGMSIKRHPTAKKNIQIGSLLGIKTKSEQAWSLGVVRWVSCGNHEKLEIGVELISPNAECAIAVINDMEQDEMVLLLPAIIATKQLASLVAPIGTYKAARSLTLLNNNESKHVILTKLIERSSHFERMQYSVIS